ncbi:MAG TPA: SDR family NAD(P)-dependent oxidoreductase [Methylococcaceae bacterium]|nr:SDR family NAD(P)-dependent oxidoreductase [Methylococcaceae bacterium]HIN69313.1 SDR family NAD(P)-dependent oxidoreductase [Methylococcales bacterium]HIA44767.1 SDR family NAD(P)-dependent oxidoreductase [Methylococcaceae bacterium]HIB63012.1 SDR family NAD(P)-dependent oxidoreductase [Methylococcaceae bacterium]HIO12387.1 SDR family NAD(P)-dependent oxidoreductase [Methylococcales bacterium]
MSGLMRSVLVTGASSGIGRAVAKALLRQGYFVFGTSRDCSQFETSHSHFLPVEMDFSTLSLLAEQAKQLQIKHPSISVIVFCAGYGRFGSLEQFSYQQIDSLMTVNFTGQAVLARAFVPGFKRKDRADLIFIGSESALQGRRQGAVYCASKFAVRGFSQALREECAKSQVKVTLINPGMVKTEFFEPLAFEPGDDESNYILPEDLAAAVNYILMTRPGIVVDELVINPLNKVVKFK